jgi:hypothetical protein
MFCGNVYNFTKNIHNMSSTDIFWNKVLSIVPFLQSAFLNQGFHHSWLIKPSQYFLQNYCFLLIIQETRQF